MNNSIIFKCNESEVDLLNNKSISFSFLQRPNKHQLQKKISKIGLDFLVVGLVASYADRKILRKNTYNGWTRNINITIPVIEYEKWVSNKSLLEELLSFLSGDFWSIEFTKREMAKTEIDFNKRDKRIQKSQIPSGNNIDMCMFSGGLDSFIGAIDLLSGNNKNIVFVNIHGGGNSLEKDFNNAKEALKPLFNIQGMNVLFRTYNSSPGKAEEDSTRARSFTFFTHAIALSTCFDNVQRLIIPENGTISLNVPLTPGRFASASTRTTHPFYINKLQLLINNMGLSIKLVNPYQFKTKGEMILQCKNQKLLKDNIGKTMSCSHSTVDRYRHDGKSKHCGYCLPCLIRKAAEIKAYGSTITEYPDEIGDTYNRLSTYRCLNLKMLSNEKGNKISEILKNGQLSDNLDEYYKLYERSLKELKDMLDKCEKQ